MQIIQEESTFNESGPISRDPQCQHLLASLIALHQVDVLFGMPHNSLVWQPKLASSKSIHQIRPLPKMVPSKIGYNCRTFCWELVNTICALPSRGKHLMLPSQCNFVILMLMCSINASLITQAESGGLLFAYTIDPGTPPMKIALGYYVWVYALKSIGR